MDLEKLKRFFKKDDAENGAGRNTDPTSPEPAGMPGGLQEMLAQRMLRQQLQKMGGDPNALNGKMGSLMDVIKGAGQRKFANNDEMMEFLISRLASSMGQNLTLEQLEQIRSKAKKGIPGISEK